MLLTLGNTAPTLVKLCSHHFLFIFIYLLIQQKYQYTVSITKALNIPGMTINNQESKNLRGADAITI